MTDELVEATAALFAPLRAQYIPKLDPRLFKRPPIKFIATIIAGVSKKTGFASGLFTEDQLRGNLTEREDKLNFFIDLKAYTELLIGEKIDVDPKAIAAGKEVDKTLLFLQAILGASENPKIPFDAPLAQVIAARPPPRTAEADDGAPAPAKPQVKKAEGAAAKAPGKKAAAKPEGAPAKPPGKKAAAKAAADDVRPPEDKPDAKPPEEKPPAKPAGKRAGKSPAKTAEDDPKPPEDKPAGKRAAKSRAKTTAPTEEDAKPPPDEEKPKKKPAEDAKPPAEEKRKPAGKAKAVDEIPAEGDGEPAPLPKKKPPPKKKAADAASEASKVSRKPPPRPKEEQKVVVDVVAPAVVQDAVVDDEVDDIFVEEDNRGAQVGGEEGGKLVKSILDVVRQMGSEQTKGGDDDRFRQGIEVARNLLQLLAMSAQPLDTLIQFSQEDLGNMENEYKRWTAECERQQKKLEEERLATEQQLAELRGKVDELDKEIVHQQTKLRSMKAAAFLKEHDLMRQFAASCGGS
jgi:hypothetical protein